MHHDHICATYFRIMRQEAELSGRLWDPPEAEEMHHVARRIIEIAKSNLVLRYWNVNYNLVDVSLVPRPKDATIAARESVGGHTNLVLAISDYALSYLYGPDWRYTEDGYTHQELTEAVRRHDLPENVTGDTPDDGNRDEAAKVAAEQQYHKWYSGLAPSRDVDFDRKVRQLLAEMEGKTSPTGKLIYCADKVALIIMGLCYDAAGIPPLRYPSDTCMTERDHREIISCSFHTDDGGYYASEMWTLDYLKFRQLVQYDEIGFFTSLLVMVTLIVNGGWYPWRKQDYPL